MAMHAQDIEDLIRESFPDAQDHASRATTAPISRPR